MKNNDKSTTEFEVNGIYERYEARRLPETEGSLPETSVNGMLDQMFDIQEAGHERKYGQDLGPKLNTAVRYVLAAARLYAGTVKLIEMGGPNGG